ALATDSDRMIFQNLPHNGILTGEMNENRGNTGHHDGLWKSTVPGNGPSAPCSPGELCGYGHPIALTEFATGSEITDIVGVAFFEGKLELTLMMGDNLQNNSLAIQYFGPVAG